MRRAPLGLGLLVTLATALGAGSGRDALAAPRPAIDIAPRKGNVSRLLRFFVRGDKKAAEALRLPADARDYRYVMVKGLLGNHYPGYMARTEKAMRDKGLSVEFAPINTGAGVAENAAVLEQMIKTTDRPIVFLGYSKGVADVSTAIARLGESDPAFLQRRVRGLVSLHGAYGGSPVADRVAASKWGLGFMKLVARLVKGSPDAGLDLRTEVRQQAIEAHPMPTALVPTVSAVGYSMSLRSFMAPGVFWMRKVRNERSDGLLPHQRAIIKGGDHAFVNVDHMSPAYGEAGTQVALGLIGHVLRMPQIIE